MSKSYAMAGLRIGWLASHDRDLLARVAAFKDYTTICSSGPSEILAIIALRARDQVLGRSRGIVLGNIALLDAFFARWPDAFAWVRPRAGSIGYPRLTVPGITIDDWAARLVEAEGVLLLPASRFGDPSDHFRIGFGREDLPRGAGSTRGATRSGPCARASAGSRERPARRGAGSREREGQDGPAVPGPRDLEDRRGQADQGRPQPRSSAAREDGRPSRTQEEQTRGDAVRNPSPGSSRRAPRRHPGRAPPARGRPSARPSGALARQVQERQRHDGRPDAATPTLDGPLDGQPRAERLVLRRHARRAPGPA